MRVQSFVWLLAYAVAAAPPLHAVDEASLLNAVDARALERHARAIVQHRRDGGSPGENAAVDYVIETLRADGIEVEVHLFPGYVSDPGICALRVDGAEPSEPACRTQALAAATPEGGIRGDLVYVATGAPSDYENVDVRGKVVLVNDLPLPWGVKNAEDRGAIGAVFMSYSELIQELTVSPIWGTPTHENYQQLPKIPSVNINKPDGDALREALASGTVTVAMETEVDTGWKTLKLAIASVRSEKDPDGFVLVGGHIDGWHYGAVDEGASNAAMVEMARIFHRNRGELERGLKLAWWPAHSNGRYAGSAWYVDHAWLELRDHALAYMNIDGVGQIGATIYGSSNTASMDELASSVLRDVASVEGRRSRPGRNSDQGFYGVGLPLLQFSHGRADPGGRYWFWHTTEDTFDKIDFRILAGDTKLYVAALSRLLTNATPPLRLADALRELKDRLEERSGWGSDPIDLSRVLLKAEELLTLTRELDRRLASSSGATGADIARRMVRVLRPVLRVTYEQNGPYHQDPALPIATLPGLAPLETLSQHPRGSDLYRFTRVHLVRERNRLDDHLDQALLEARALSQLLSDDAR